ncbi:MAG: hypothetical protein QOE77_768 [Blastocatellia bacterium]|jgi:hypothetical protein|nr:hypothetical protein [Blastocatellia bacterium]
MQRVVLFPSISPLFLFEIGEIRVICGQIPPLLSAFRVYRKAGYYLRFAAGRNFRLRVSEQGIYA